ncbi:MAG: hypothetical protein K0S45_965, partial [Nitrospira sp.]|nr:hypothetical protein [Nitrospira sp.]
EIGSFSWHYLEAGQDLIWSGKGDLNPRPSPWQGDALPLSYSRFVSDRSSGILPAAEMTVKPTLRNYQWTILPPAQCGGQTSQLPNVARYAPIVALSLLAQNHLLLLCT